MVMKKKIGGSNAKGGFSNGGCTKCGCSDYYPDSLVDDCDDWYTPESDRWYVEDDKRIRRNAETILPPPPLRPTFEDTYNSLKDGEIDGIERCLGLVEEILEKERTRKEMLEESYADTSFRSIDYDKLATRIDRKDGSIKTLKRLIKSFKHFRRQAEGDRE